MSVAHAAVESQLNGDSPGYRYGTDPNDANTWDARKIFACICDAGYEGHDCLDRTCISVCACLSWLHCTVITLCIHVHVPTVSCPAGDDPSTMNQADEVQILQCTATDGSFQLSFRSVQTLDIPFDVSATELESYLESMSTIDDVEVVFTSGATSSLCTDQSVPHYALVTFTTDHGDLPALTPIVSKLIDLNSGNTAGSGAIGVAHDGQSLGAYTSARGTKENVVCCNKGICDFYTGECVCVAGYGSSDGKGSQGSKGDCGFRLPYAANR